MSGRSQLTIARLNAVYLTPREQPDPEHTRARLDGMLRSRVGPALADALRPLLDDRRPDVWLIRRLHSDLDLQLGAGSEERLAQLWGRQMAAAVVRAVQQPPDGDNVLHFPTRSAYVAHFLRDCAAGRAWGEWQYRTFDGLRSLSLSQTLREAILREGEQAPAVVRQLADEGWLDQVLPHLTAADAARVAQACLGPEKQQAVGSPVLEQLLDRWPAARLEGATGSWATPHNALRLWAAGQAAGDPESGPAAAAGIRLLLALADLLNRLPDPRGLLQRLVAGEGTAAAAEAVALGLSEAALALPALARLVRQAPATLERAARVLIPPSTAPAIPRLGSQEILTVASEFGGLFLLMPALLKLEVDRLIEAHAPPGAAPLWRYWLALRLLGAPRHAPAAHDPGLLLAVGLPVRPEPEVLAATAALSGEPLAALQRDYLAVLARQRRASGRLLAVERVPDQDGRPHATVVRDMEGDYWLAVGDARRDKRLAAEAATALGERPLCLWRPGQPPPAGPAAGHAAAVEAFAGHARPAAEALDYLSVAEQPDSLGWPLAVVAQGILRTFARGLMGFGWSSPEYLYTNFLRGPGNIHVSGDGLVVHLRSAPLHLVLRLAGADRQRFVIPWLDERPVTLGLD